MAIKRATRKNQFVKIGMSGPSGSGKTYSALLLAHGLVGNWNDIAVLDTENNSAENYADLCGNDESFGCMEMLPPFNPERFIKAIKHFEEEGVKCMIIDSASHEWEGDGGILDMKKNMSGNDFTKWNVLTPLHNKFLQTILHSKMHIIVTARRKQEYVLEENAKGKMAPVKKGMKVVQREGMEYEFTVAFDVEINHYSLSDKDRTGLFRTQVPFLIDESTGVKLRRWANGESVAQINEGI